MATVLFTGAARGIGHELVNRALRRGDRVFAAVRQERDRARFTPHPNLQIVTMDAGDDASVAAMFVKLDGLLAGKVLDAVVHSAAISKPNAIEVASMDEFAQTLNTNTLGSLRIIKGAIPRLRGHGGRLVLLTSLWGKASGPLLAAYCASKHAIESLADVARRETRDMNLHVILVEPGVVRTDMLSTQAADIDASVQGMSAIQRTDYKHLYKRYSALTVRAAKSALSCEQCAQVIERALSDARPRARYRAGNDAKAVCFLTWLLPDRWMDALLARTLNNRPQ